MSRWRTLLILGRVSNLPTVWSNCLAGWWLGGGATVGKLPFVLAGATCLYLGGTFLNDAFDADFDRQHRRERPIPSGSISVETVRRWGLAWLALGMLSLFRLGMEAGVLGLVLLLCILLECPRSPRCGRSTKLSPQSAETGSTATMPLELGSTRALACSDQRLAGRRRAQRNH
jgi:4-hydroxybenzoate polyprenyltransferase